ncbi:phosphate propanoyltransferase [Lactovum odontotermitis]
MEDFEEVLRILTEQLSGGGNFGATGAPGASGTSQVSTEEATEIKGSVIERGFSVPLGVSNHHIHLAKQEADILFGENYQFHILKNLSQPGQYASKETVTLCGPKGRIDGVRILGPLREQTQVEIFAADCFKLGVKAPIRLSGDLAGTPGITIVGPQGSVAIDSGVMVAKRHVHMLPSDAEYYGVVDHQNVSIELEGVRGGILRNTIIRVTNTSKLDCHLDIEEANALCPNGTNKIRIIAE